jgi:hypothetical protein
MVDNVRRKRRGEFEQKLAQMVRQLAFHAGA